MGFLGEFTKTPIPNNITRRSIQELTELFRLIKMKHFYSNLNSYTVQCPYKNKFILNKICT